MQIDLDMAENMPINSDLPIFLAAGIFYDTLLELGFQEEDAELARIAFFAYKPQIKEESKEPMKFPSKDFADQL